VAREVEFRAEALADLESLYDFISAQNSPAVAIGYVRRIREKCLALADFPERGTKRSDILPGLRTLGFERRVTIAFRVFKTKVEIVTIAYGGRQFEPESRQRKS
jgi:toxin ParE1/3/4